MRPRNILLVTGLLLFSLVAASAQTWLPTTSSRSWNTYVPTVIPDGFSSIIGSGGTRFPNSGNVGQNSYGEYCYTFPLPFPFYFMGTTYPQNQNILISTNGYISFDNTGYGSTNGSYQQYYSYYGIYWISNQGGPAGSRLICAYISSNSTSLSSGDGGVYWRLDGSAPNRVLTIEWKVAEMYSYYTTAGAFWNYQVKMYEATGNIEYFYGPQDWNRSYYFYHSALVGLKKYGEYYYYSGTQPTPTTRNGAESDRYYFFNNPAYGEGDTVAVTGLQIQWWGSYGYVEYYPYYYNAPQYGQDPTRTKYGWHCTFPSRDGERVGYKMSPVLNDVKCDSAWLAPVRTANAYAPGATITVSAKFTNMGGNPRQNVPVRADVFRNGTYLTNITGTIFPSSTPQFSSQNYTFPTNIASTFTMVTGVYELRVYPQLTGDQDPGNDTTKLTFYMSRDNDVMPYTTLQPLSNVPPLGQKYPVGVGVPIEIRFLNIGLRAQSNVPVGIMIFDASGTMIHRETATLPGNWGSITYRDWVFSNWTPSQPGVYYVRAFTAMAGDEQPFNDTLPRWPEIGKPFDVRYEIEIQAVDPVLGGNSPAQSAQFPMGRPIPVLATFANSGVSDATNVPVRLQIRNAAGTVVYDRTSTALDIRGDYGRTGVPFAQFTPLAAGQYCATAFSEYADEPIRSNDTITWCFNVKPALSGTIRVGFGERFRTITEARDSLFYYGVSGPVTFELTDDAYTVTTNEKSTPALDFRGRIMGLSASNPVTWRPHSSKTMVTVRLRSASGVGMWFGQIDTSNASGYITWDGGTRKALTFTYENTQTNTAQPAYQRSIPFFYSQGASNYGVRNSTIRPYDAASGKVSSLTIPMVRYNQSFNEFQYSLDVNLAVSAGIFLRNSAPIDPVIGRNWNNRDTLRNQNNTFEGNTISGFGYGVLSVGAGPLFVVGSGRYEEYMNQNNKYNGNTIQDVTRGGIVVTYEKNSEMIGNTIRRVSNSTSTPGAAGISATAGGNTITPGAPTPNRGYATDLKIERNRIYDITANTGDAAAVSIETNENVFITPSNIVYRFPTGAATNIRIWNNSFWDYAALRGSAAAVAFQPETTVRIDYMTSGNRVENNSIYTVGSGNAGLLAPATSEFGIVATRSGMQIRNNIINLEGFGALGLAIAAPSASQTVVSDYNAFDIPNGYIGSLTNLSTQGYWLPSPAVAPTLNQWRTLTSMDLNSISGDVTREFVSTTPGSEDLHIQTNLMGSLVGNRGVVITGLSSDIDGEPRGASSVAGRYDIGSDEFTGQVRNYDVMAEDVIAPAGYRAPTGRYADAEYVMTDTLVSLATRVRNIGGQPMTNRAVTLTIEYLNPTSGSGTQVFTQTVNNVSIDVSQYATTTFGTFMPRSLRELGLNDGFYGRSTNVTPVYRFTVRTGIDDNQTNNSYVKLVRFYVQRSGREAMVSVENLNNWTGGSDAISLSNRLNADTLLAALTRINWGVTDGVGREDYDLFERDKWPAENLNFAPWTTMIWSQGSESEGLVPQERVALKAMLNAGTSFYRSTLIMAGQNVARVHDVALNGSNGTIADQDFVRNYLRAEYRGNTNPSTYSYRTIRGEAINAGRYEELEPTGVVGDASPVPSLMRTTAGEGVARASHVYSQQTGQVVDSVAGVASSAASRNVVYYGFDWRHAGRYNYEPDRSGAWRLLLGALDFSQSFRGVLPIELVSFEAYQSAERAVTLEWATTMETETSSMEIERATVVRDERGEQVGSFSVVDRVSPRGTATSGASYRVIDRGVEPTGEYVYRLVTTNLEGVRVVEQERRVKMTGAAAAGMSLTVLPNPVRTTGSVRLSAPEEVKSSVALYDETGRLAVNLGEVTGSQTLVIDATALSSGTYTVRVRTSTGVELVERVTVAK